MSKYPIRKWIREQAERGRIHFTLEELRKTFPTANGSTVHSTLYRAVQGGLLQGAWRGFYLIMRPEYRRAGIMPPEEYIHELMGYLGRPYCVTLLSAAAIYGAAHQRPMSFMVMTSSPQPMPVTRHNSRIQFVSKTELSQGMPEELIRIVQTQYSEMQVATPEFTALSLVQYARESGGLSQVSTVLAELAEECHFAEMPGSMERYVPQPCFQRLGYLLDRVVGASQAARDLECFMSARGFALRRTLLSPHSAEIPAGCDDRWKILINVFPTTDFND